MVFPKRRELHRPSSGCRRRNWGTEAINYKIRDWLFSRQRYWGEPFPVIHWEDGEITLLEDAELPLATS